MFLTDNSLAWCFLCFGLKEARLAPRLLKSQHTIRQETARNSGISVAPHYSFRHASQIAACIVPSDILKSERNIRSRKKAFLFKHWVPEFCFEACRERVEIPSNKPFITFQGAGRSVTLITGNSAARDWNREFSSAQGTYHSCVVGVNADHFIARNISFQVCSFFCIYPNFDIPLDDPPCIEKFAAALFEHMFIHSSYTVCCMGLGSSTPSQGFESCYRTTLFRYWS